MFQQQQIAKYFLGLLIFISSPFLLYSSHIIGGKITYRYLGTNKYEIKLTVYRDCSDIVDFDNPSPITIYNNDNNNLVTSNLVSLFYRDTLQPINPDPCFIPPSGICVEEGYYLDTVFLAPNINGYTISFQRCCHNVSVLNIYNPSMVGITITAQIPPQINNSASFLNYPPIYICVNDTFNYSFASMDIDGDSLVYNLCHLYSGGTNFNVMPTPANPPPYTQIPWVTGYSATNPVNSQNGITFNSTNGTIQFVPTTIGQFAVGVCVDEFRNGILLNTNRLEMQFNVVPCYLVSSIPTATNLCEGLNINFQNGSNNATNFHWDFGDTNLSSDTSNIAIPSYTYSNYGTYTVSLIAINNSYGACKDTTTKVINVNPLLAPTLQPNYTSCYKNNYINLLVGGAFDNTATFNWNLGINATPSNPTTFNPTVHFDTIIQPISVVVSQYGCTDTLFSQINFINPIASINTNNLNCNDTTLHFVSFSDNYNNLYWDFGIPNITSDTSTYDDVYYTYPSYGNYTVTLIAYNGSCSDTATEQINVYPKLKLDWINTVETQCLKNNSFNFTPTGIWGSNATFFWAFYNSSNTTTLNIQSPTNITYTTTGYKLVKFLVSENGCTKYAQAVVNVLPNPTANFYVSDSVACQPLTTTLYNQSTSTIPYTSQWQINNATQNNLDSILILNNSGLYSITLIVTDTNNCTDTLTKQNYINVLPKPQVSVHATPIITDILSPEINFTINTNTQNQTILNFGDNNFTIQQNTFHTYTDTGNYQYTLITQNNFNCLDTIKGTIIIKPYNAIFIPNTFTPNNDGLNDYYTPIIPYYKSVDVKIYNRWGQLIFKTNDITQGWDGKQNNTPVKTDVYNYLINIEFLDNTTQTKTGQINLIR